MHLVRFPSHTHLATGPERLSKPSFMCFGPVWSQLECHLREGAVTALSQTLLHCLILSSMEHFVLSR